jgi:serine/threonine-protein kinase HipA
MSSSQQYSNAFVWIWLPGEVEPVVAGQLVAHEGQLKFNYGKSYLDKENAIPVYLPELPLQIGDIELLPGLDMPNCIRDASPDAWGRRVIINKKMGKKGKDVDSDQLDELTYLLESGSDRIGALDFQQSATEYVERSAKTATLEELLTSAEKVEKGIPLSPELDQALNHGTSIGGARPKASINDDQVKYIAKFSSSTDTYSVVKAEYIAMRLADIAGLDVAKVKMEEAARKDVLLVERFDRVHTDKGWQRKLIVSALTILGLKEDLARYASYQDLAEIIRHRFTQPRETLRELYSRIVFNILCGNTDDHARNHAAFWDGEYLMLTPAYDICPQGRTGQEASQAMEIIDGDRMSRLSTCLKATGQFQLSQKEGRDIIEHLIGVIKENWDRVCDEAELNETDRTLFWGRQFLNPYAFYDLSGEEEYLRELMVR